MSQIHPIRSSCPLHRTMMHGKSHSIAPTQRNDLRPGLHAWTLFRQHKLAAHKLLSGFREQNGHLYWEDMLPIEVLMQAVIIAFAILQQQRSRPDLSRIMASSDKIGMHLRITHLRPHGRVPTIRNRRKPGIDHGTQPFDNSGQRITEVLILSTSKAMPPHHDTASKVPVLRIEFGQDPTLLSIENAF